MKQKAKRLLYQQLVEADKTRLGILRSQQAAAIAAQSMGRDYSTTSQYPWAGVEPFPSDGVDPWGFYYRQCTSYAAWRRANLRHPCRLGDFWVRPMPKIGQIGLGNFK